MTKLIRKLPKISGLRKLSDAFNPPTPDLPAPPTLPDEEELKRQQRLLQANQQKGGRSGTILSEPRTDVFGS